MSERRLLGSGFPDDAGGVDPVLAQALAGWAGAPGGAPAPPDPAEVVAALVGTRLLVPVVAVLGDVEVDEAGLARDKSSDMAAVLMQGADGRLALLAFSSTAAMAAWDPAARPVPVPAPTAARAALQEQAAALVLDVAGPVTVVVEDDALRALAAGAPGDWPLPGMVH